MADMGNLYVYASKKKAGIYCYSADQSDVGLPPTLSPWLGIGVLRPDQVIPHGLSRQDVESGIRAKGYQLWRKKSQFIATGAQEG
jgi:hypothetical protein